METKLLERARNNCVARAESLMQAELAQIQAKYGVRLHPSETLIKLEAFKLALEEAKSNFANGQDEKGLETFSLVHDQLNQLVSKLLHGR